MEKQRALCMRGGTPQNFLYGLIFSLSVASLLSQTLADFQRSDGLYGVSLPSEKDGPNGAGTVPSSLREGVPGFSETSILALIDGEADSVNSCYVELPSSVGLDDVEFVQTSSNPDVYDPRDNENLLVTFGYDGQSLNVTISNSFEGLVGKTSYEFLCMLRSNGTVLYSARISYIIVGMSFYRLSPESGVQKVSGYQNRYDISYQVALDFPHVEEHAIHVLIQYPDGTSSDDIKSGNFPKHESLAITVAQFKGEFLHDANLCDANQMGSYSPATGLTLPAGCGYGFYRGATGDLLFGIQYSRYRVGLIVFDISWAALVEPVQALAEDGYSERLDVQITGEPPLVVTDIRPKNTLFRKEGGQKLSVTFYNADLRPSYAREFVVQNVSVSFLEVPGSYKSLGAPTYLEEATYVVEPGFGRDLECYLQYYDRNFENDPFPQEALFDGVSYTFSYDTRDIEIDSISPVTALEEGGTTIVLKGYFEGYDPRYDGVYFNDKRIEITYKLISTTRIEFILPPKTEVGDGFDFEVDIRVGYARSPKISFRYVVTFAEVRITQSGTTQIAGDHVYRLGDCTPGLMTAVVSPFTSQVERYEWSLVLESSGTNTAEILETLENPSVNSSQQTIAIQPSHLVVGETYILSVKVTMPGAVAETSIVLVREHAVIIGSYILKPPVRSIAYPETPLRLSAVVEIPGDCYNGTQGLMFEWIGFGKTQRYSPKDATGTLFAYDEQEPSPARLGREFIVPQSVLTVGDHEIIFKTWMEESPFVAGSARAIVQIVHTPLQAVIRGGESLVRVNSQTNLEMTGIYSRDPDVAEDEDFFSTVIPLSYEWTCLQTTGEADFKNEAAIRACDGSLLPAGSQSAEFTVSRELFEILAGEITAIRYGLVVKKDGRVSAPTYLTVVVDPLTGRESFLTDYTLELQDCDGNLQDSRDIKYYKSFVLDVRTPQEDVSWTYQLVDPPFSNILDSSSLLQTSVYYSPDTVSVTGNRKPLGVYPLMFDPFTKYTIKVSFSGSAMFEDTDVFVSFQTSQAPALNFPEPSIMNGTTLTQYVATAGIPGDDSEMSYSFILKDSDGMEFCVGGCIGHSVAYFRIGRPGNYTLSVMLHDSQGKALLATKTLTRPIVVSAPAVPHNLVQELEELFANGDDASWTQLAYDLAIQMEDPSANLTVPDGLHASLADGLRKIICDSRPSTGHGQLAMDLATQLSSIPGMTQQIFYDLAGTSDCTVTNTPVGTSTTFSVSDMVTYLGVFVEQERLEFEGTGRRRLLQTATEKPFNLRADHVDWSTKATLATALASKEVGHVATKPGQTVALVTNNIQLPTLRVNGERQYGLEVDGGHMKFYAKSRCVDGMFPLRGNERKSKRYMSVSKVSNFVDADHFQADGPPGGYLAGEMMLVQVFEKDANGVLQELSLAVGEDSDPCFCSEMPIEQEHETLDNTLGAVPNSFSVSNTKPFGVVANETGEFFKFETDAATTLAYEVLNGSRRSWVETCGRTVGFSGPTIATGRAQSAQGSGARLIGVGGVGLVGMVLAGLGFTVIAVVASWVIATRSLAAGEAPPAALEAHGMYVERDIYGRETIFGKAGEDGAAGGAAGAAGAGMDGGGDGGGSAGGSDVDSDG